VSLVMSGGELAASIRAETAGLAAELTAAGRTPTLAVVTATADEASAWYVRSLSRTAAKVGIACDITDLGPASPSRPESPDAAVESIRVELIALSENPLVHGIVLQTPLPGGARLAELAGLIDPAKDVDGANPVSLGRLMTGLPTFAPATAEAVLALLDFHQVALSGRRAVVVAVGPMLSPVLEAVADLDVTVAYATTVRPFDAAGLRSLESGSGAVVLVEPYLAGTSSHAVASALTSRPHRLLSLGVPLGELRRYGTPAEHAAFHGLDAAGIRRSVTGFLGLTA